MKASRITAWAVAAVLGAVACSDGALTDSRPQALAFIAVALNSSHARVGETVRASATLRNNAGTALSGRNISWSSTNPSVASVANDGMISARGAGTTMIAATSDGKTGSATLTVDPSDASTSSSGSVAAVTVILDRNVVQPGDTTRAYAVARDADGNVLTGREVTWVSGNTAIATISAQGLVTAVAPGSIAIIGISEGQTGGAVLTVPAPAPPPPPSGPPAPSGPAPVASVGVSLGTSTMTIGQGVQAVAVLRDANGNALTGRNIQWISTNTSVTTITETGFVTAVGAGPVTIVAISEGQIGSAILTVQTAAPTSPPPPTTPPTTSTPVAAVRVVLPSTSLDVGQTAQATAVVTDSIGDLLTGRPITWESSNTSVSTVSSTGLVTGVAPGTSTISASTGGKRGSQGHSVKTASTTTAAVASVAVSLGATSLAPGQTTQATAVTRDVGGNVLAGRVITWASSNSAVATVSSSGVVTSVAQGPVSIIATSESISGNAGLNVTAVPVAVVAITLGTSSLQPGQTTLASAVTRDAAGNVLTNRVVTFTSTNAAVATVNAGGLVTAVAAGSASIVAISETQVGSVPLSVQAPAPAPVATLTINLNASSLQIGQTTQAAAVARDAAGNLLTGRIVAWSSTNNAVATVSTAGLVTAVGTGTVTIRGTSEGVIGNGSLSVVQVPVSTVTVSLGASSLTVGQTTQAAAVTRDVNGNTLTGRVVTWSSNNTAIATVSSSGVVTAVAAGSATITATSETRTGTAAVSVAAAPTPPPPAPVATVSVSLGSSTLQVGGTTQASAVARDASGNVLSGRAVTWTSSNNAVATVSSTGLVTAVAAGSATISGTSETRVGSASLTVQAPAPPPPPPTGSGSPQPAVGDVIIHQDNFDARTNFSGYATAGTMSLITGRGGSGKAARFSYSPGSSDNLIEKGFSSSTDVYFRYYYRISAGWFPYSGRTGSGMKWFMPWRGSGPRYTCGVGQLTSPNWQFTCHDNSSASQPNPVGQNKASNPSFATTNDGQWHEYVLHIVTGTGGYEQIWIDGVLVLDDSGKGWDHAAEGISLVQFPGLVVDGIPDTSWSGTIDIDDFVIWHR